MRGSHRLTFAVALVLVAELLVQHGLFVDDDEQEESGPQDRAVLEHRDAPEQQALARDQRRDCDVHRIADVAIEPGDDEALGRHHGRRCAEALQREASERIEQDGQPGDNQGGAEHARDREQRWREVPGREVPRDEHGERPRSDDQEDRGTDDRGGALHDRRLLDAAANPADLARAGVSGRLDRGVRRRSAT